MAAVVSGPHALLGLTLAISLHAALPATAQQAGPQQAGPQQAGPQQAGQQGKPAAGARKRAPHAANAEKSAPAGEKPDAATAQAQIETGIKALEAGKVDAAVSSLSSGLAAGSLPAAQTARALYYRGIAFRRQSKPALAIADLTSALWLKGALNEQQRADALKNRTEAYAEAGLAERAPSDAERKAGASSVQTSSIGGSGQASAASFNLFAGFGAPSAAPATPAPAPAPQQAATAAPAGESGGLGSLFGGLFGGPPPPASSAAQTTAQPPAQVASATITKPWATSTDAPAWSSTTSMTAPAGTAQAPPEKQQWNTVTRVSAAPGAKPAAIDAGPATGNYRVQFAAVRSNDEAVGIASQVQQRYGQLLGNRSPAIDRTVMGNMGEIYRVKVGPFATAAQSQAVCDRIKADGMDCLVVSQ